VYVASRIVFGDEHVGKQVVCWPKTKPQAEAQGFARGENRNEALPANNFWLRI
jgi:hypothetical protein